jgi:hypothetical protein
VIFLSFGGLSSNFVCMKRWNYDDFIMSYEKLKTSAVLMMEHHSTLLWAAAQWYHTALLHAGALSSYFITFSAWTMAVSLLCDARQLYRFSHFHARASEWEHDLLFEFRALTCLIFSQRDLRIPSGSARVQVRLSCLCNIAESFMLGVVLHCVQR